MNNQEEKKEYIHIADMQSFIERDCQRLFNELNTEPSPCEISLEVYTGLQKADEFKDRVRKVLPELKFKKQALEDKLGKKLRCIEVKAKSIPETMHQSAMTTITASFVEV